LSIEEQESAATLAQQLAEFQAAHAQASLEAEETFKREQTKRLLELGEREKHEANQAHADVSKALRALLHPPVPGLVEPPIDEAALAEVQDKVRQMIAPTFERAAKARTEIAALSKEYRQILDEGPGRQTHHDTRQQEPDDWHAQQRYGHNGERGQQTAEHNGEIRTARAIHHDTAQRHRDQADPDGQAHQKSGLAERGAPRLEEPRPKAHHHLAPFKILSTKIAAR